MQTGQSGEKTSDYALRHLRTPGILARVRRSPSFGIVAILVVMSIVLSVFSSQFLTSDNLLSVFRQFSFIGIMAIGQVMVIVTGGIDLSVGSVFAFAGVTSAFAMTKLGLGVPAGLLIGIVSGLAFGLLNGLLITRLKLPPFIATLGTLSIARGLSYALTGGFPIPDLPLAFKFLGQGYIEHCTVSGHPAPRARRDFFLLHENDGARPSGLCNGKQ